MQAGTRQRCKREETKRGGGGLKKREQKRMRERDWIVFDVLAERQEVKLIDSRGRAALRNRPDNVSVSGKHLWFWQLFFFFLFIALH